MMVSRNFSLAELTRSETARARKIDNRPSGEAFGNLRITAFGLEQVRKACGGRPVRVLSGFRCRVLNLSVGGTATSAHVQGLAADIVVDGLTAGGLAQRIRDSDVAFDQVIYEPSRGIVHIGFDPKLRGEVLTQEKGPGTPFVRGLLV